MDCFKALELTEKGFIKPGIYLSEVYNLIIFYPSRYGSQIQSYYINDWNKWMFQILDKENVKMISKTFDYEKLCDL